MLMNEKKSSLIAILHQYSNAIYLHKFSRDRNDPHCEKTRFLLKRKQRCRSASQ